MSLKQAFAEGFFESLDLDFDEVNEPEELFSLDELLEDDQMDISMEDEFSSSPSSIGKSLHPDKND
jgi:hypothetical protein